jgi:hypothetical protein
MLQTTDGGRQVTRSQDLHTLPDPHPRYKHFGRICSTISLAPRLQITMFHVEQFGPICRRHNASLDLRVTRGVSRETSLDLTDIGASWIET